MEHILLFKGYSCSYKVSGIYDRLKLLILLAVLLLTENTNDSSVSWIISYEIRLPSIFIYHYPLLQS